MSLSLTGLLISRDASARRDLAFLGALFGAVYLQFLGRIPLIEPDEGRYAEIPREMLERGDFVTPFLNYVKYFEKPPLIYWLNALSLRLFGENEFAARLPSALCGILTILFVYHLGRKLFGRRTGFVAALILGSCTGFMVQSRMILTDMALTCCLTASLGSFAIASQEGELHKKIYYSCFYLFAALAVLAKGLIGMVLPAGVILCAIAATRRFSLLREMRPFSGLFLFLLVVSPWFILVSLRNPEFARFFFIHEHLERFLTKVHGRYEPFWFFLPVLAGGMLPWSFILPSSFHEVWRKRREPQAFARLYLVLWFLVILLFFSKSSSKMVPYILPVYPAGALLAALLVERSLDEGVRPFRIPLCLLGTVLVLAAFAGVTYGFLAPHPFLTLPEIGTIAVILLVQGGIVLIATRRDDTPLLLRGVIGTSLVLMLAGPPLVFGTISEYKSCKKFGDAITRLAKPDTVVVSQNLRQGLPFYARRRIVVFDGAGEAEFGSQQGDHSAWFIDRDRLYLLWRSERPVIALIKRDFLPVLQESVGSAPQIVAEDPKSVLVSNR